MNPLSLFPRWFIPIVGSLCLAVIYFGQGESHVQGQYQLGWLQFVIQIAIMIVSSLISAALAPKPKPPKPASITDFELPTAEEGREIPVVFGEVWITGPNVLWYGDLASKPIKKKAKKK